MLKYSCVAAKAITASTNGSNQGGALNISSSTNGISTNAVRTLFMECRTPKSLDAEMVHRERDFALMRSARPARRSGVRVFENRQSLQAGVCRRNRAKAFR